MTEALGAERNDTIDVFRAIAILSVMLYHYSTNVSITGIPFGSAEAWLELGRFGVHVFFIISGIVIAMTLTRSASVADFAVKRAARIYPAYLVAMLATYLFTKAVFVPEFWLSKAQLLENILPYDFGQKMVDPSYWSLTYEIQFYALAALMFFLLGGRFWIALAVITVAGALLVAAKPDISLTYRMPLYLPLFLAGVGTWKVRYEGETAGWLAIVIALGCYVLTSSYMDTREHHYAPWMMHLFILGLGALLITLVVAKAKLRWIILPAIGRVSYSLYLLHQVIGLTIIRVLYQHHVPAPVAIAAASAFVIAAAFVMFHLVEERGRRLILSLYHRLLADRLSARPA